VIKLGICHARKKENQNRKKLLIKSPPKPSVPEFPMCFVVLLVVVFVCLRTTPNPLQECPQALPGHHITAYHSMRSKVLMKISGVAANLTKTKTINKLNKLRRVCSVAAMSTQQKVLKISGIQNTTIWRDSWPIISDQ